MRARIDISEIEAETKIRAKYLRALENEEWDLLPGPTYVKSFLRTYADALGLDGKLLIEEYKLRHERLSDVELQPIAPPGQRERRRRPRAAIPRGWLVALVVLVLLAGLWVIGNRNSGDSGGQGSTPPPASTRHDHLVGRQGVAVQEEGRREEEGQGQAEGRAPDDRRHRPGLRVPEGGGQAHAGAGDRADRRRPAGPVQVLALPPAAGDLRGAADRQRQVAQRPVGGQRHRLRDHAREGCAACRPRSGRAAPPRERARRHRGHGHRGPHGPRDRPQRAVAVRAPARRSASTTPTRWSSATAARTWSRRCASWPRAASTSSSPAAGWGRPPTT